MTIRKKLYLMLFFVLFVIVAMTAVTYVRSRSAIVDLVDSAGMDTLSEVPVIRRGRIFPCSLRNFLRNSGSL